MADEEALEPARLYRRALPEWDEGAQPQRATARARRAVAGRAARPLGRLAFQRLTAR